MASCSTPRWVTYAPYTTLTVNIASQTGDTVTFNWSLTYYSPSAASTDGLGRAYWVSIDGNVVTNGSYNIHGVVGTTTIASGQYAVPKGTSVVVYFENQDILLEDEDYVVVPNVIGKTLKEAAMVLGAKGLAVIPGGSGTVSAQTPVAGTVVKRGAAVELYLE